MPPNQYCVKQEAAGLTLGVMKSRNGAAFAACLTYEARQSLIFFIRFSCCGGNDIEAEVSSGTRERAAHASYQLGTLDQVREQLPWEL